MSEMIERVTTALADKMNSEPSWMGDISILARTAIEAMREPTIEIINHAVAQIGDDAGYDDAWRAMISAALAQESGE